MSDFLRKAADPGSRLSLAGWAREKRWQHLIETFPALSEMRVLDLGGTPQSWKFAPITPKAVTTVNLEVHESDDASVTAIAGDACNLPASVKADHFDLVFSNSLLEHVGGHLQRQQLADTVHGAADRHWVQTPYRYFPIEPHWVFPGFQWLPYEARVQVSLRWNRGHVRTHSRTEAQDIVDEIDLLGISQMRRYFPLSTIWYERFAGLVKSLVAIQC
jgi:hypothetical protein